MANNSGNVKFVSKAMYDLFENIKLRKPITGKTLLCEKGARGDLLSKSPLAPLDPPLLMQGVRFEISLVVR